MLKVANIFTSIDGEINCFGQGTFTTFIRLAGCNLKCFYCDTSWSQGLDKAREMTEEEIVDQCMAVGCKKVTITGGEPLLQDISPLLALLCFRGFTISVETNGTMPLPIHNLVDSWVMDWKHHVDLLIDNLPLLRASDFIKIVVFDRPSYIRAFGLYKIWHDQTKAQFAFSPITSSLSHAELFEWMLKDELFDVKLNCQIHKFIWPRENTNVFTGIEH